MLFHGVTPAELLVLYYFQAESLMRHRVIHTIALLGLLLCTAIPAISQTLATPEKPVLTVYTYDSFSSDWGPGPKVKQAFEKQCQCTLKWVSLEDGVAILNRLRLEGKHTKADVVLGMDDAMIPQAQQSGLFASHQVNLKPLTIAGGWNDAVFLPYDYGYFAFVYDSSVLKQPPKTLDELVHNQTLKVVYEDPRTSTPGQGLLTWMQLTYGKQAPAAWTELARHTVTVTKGWSEAYGLFLKGQADVVLSYTTSAAYHRLAEQKNQYRVALFPQGHVRQVEVAAQLKNAAHPQLAQQFMTFILTPEFQSLIPQGNWMYPVTDMTLPAGFDLHEKPAKTLLPPLRELATQRQAWIQQWLQAVSH